jgi:hypothetical protein
MNYLLQTWYTPTLKIRLDADDILYVYSEYALDTKVQESEWKSVLDLVYCTVRVYAIKLYASTN